MARLKRWLRSLWRMRPSRRDDDPLIELKRDVEESRRRRPKAEQEKREALAGVEVLKSDAELIRRQATW
jgi:hypothetical protein